ncbi:MAG: hypothetical protein M0P27_03700, partial [Bacteroidales bacterium]|nr:hypothetical protein [Bacteroidales bacterium]
MGIRKKVSLGFVVIGSILFFSSLVLIFEFNRMRKSVTTLMQENINSVNISRELTGMTDKYNLLLAGRMFDDSLSRKIPVVYDAKFDKYISGIKRSFSSESANLIADSLQQAYAEYIAVLSHSEEIMKLEKHQQTQWYREILLPSYNKYRKFAGAIVEMTSDNLSGSTQEMQERYYRSIMPGVIAVGAGILLIILFNYFLNIYFINPLLSISKGIKSYRDYNKSYNVS